MDIVNTSRQLEAFNHWLHDAYDRETSFSTLLIEAGFHGVEVEQIMQEHLRAFLGAVLELMDSYDDLSLGRNICMVRHYGLDGDEPEGFYPMGSRFGVCGERMRQLVTKRLNLYRNPQRQAIFQNDIAEIGRQLLDSENPPPNTSNH